MQLTLAECIQKIENNALQGGANDDRSPSTREVGFCEDFMDPCSGQQPKELLT